MTRKSTRSFSILCWPFKFIWFNLRMWGYFLISLLPHPKILKGRRFVVANDMEAVGLTHWRAPMTDGFKCIIPKGTVLVAHSDSQRISRGFGLIPEKYKEFETQFVPEEQLMNAKYDGYSIVLKYTEIGKRIKPI